GKGTDRIPEPGLAVLKETFQLFRSSGEHEMHLPDLGGAQHLCMKPSPLCPKLCCLTGGSDHRTFLDCHGNGRAQVVYDEIGSDPEWQIIIGDGVVREFFVQLL